MSIGVLILLCVAIVALFVGFGLLAEGAGVPNIDQAADVMGARLLLDDVARDALKENDQEKYNLVNKARQVLEENTESQGFRNDDSSRWLPGGEEAFTKSIREIFGKAGER
jgi:hypothetical protein